MGHLPMQSQPSSQPTLLEQLDARQNDVLAELDALNQRIEQVLKQWNPAHTESTAQDRAPLEPPQPCEASLPDSK
jgi:hypothetical protein